MVPEGEDDESVEQEVVLQDIIDHYTGNVVNEVEPDEDDEPTPTRRPTLALFQLRRHTRSA
jgi:hypothetical protein